MNETVKDLKNLRDKTSEAVQALKSLGRNIDSDLLVFVVSRKMGKCILCNESNQKFNQASKNEADKKLEIPKKVEKVSQDQRVLNQKESNSTPKNDTVSLNHIRGKTVLLATAKICVVGKNGERIEIRALLDQGSEVTFITERVVQMLRVKKEPAMIRVTGIDNAFLGTAKSLVNVIITPTQNFEKKIPISALVLPKLNNHIVSKADYLSDWEHLRDLDLADPTPFDNKEFDMIIGADYYGSLLLPGLIKGPVRSPTAQATVFGWIISGPLNSLNNVSPTSKVVHHCVGLSDIHNDLQKFWEIEEFPQKSNLTDDETKCEEHFVNTHSRNEEGNYVVRYPFKNDPPERLGDSLQNAKRLLLQTERRVQNNPELKQDYYDFLNEYKDLKHMIEIDYNDEQNSNFEIENYLPYHIVIRVSSSSTPLRIVFNASFPTLTGVSLNDLLLPGPKLHADIPSIIIRWRNYRFVMTADISKMFRRIQIDKRDVNFQRIICRLNETEEIKHFQLLTLTYGVSSSPFLANRVIKQLANDEGDNFPKAKQILLNDIYVDDGLFGADDLETALQIKNEFIQLLAKGGFPVHKISSNSPLLSDSKLSKYSERLILNDTNSKAVLGLYWDPEYDVFRISMSPVVNVNFTKRNVLSVIAKQFDPLGWISPILIIAKIIIQDLWIRHLDWDETLPDDLSVRWKSYCNELNNVQKITIPRWTGLTSHDVIEIHGFADASSRAYAAVVYLRIQNVSKKINVSLLLGKTKVAPLKTLTIPRLELCAAVLLAKLLKKIVNDLQLDDVPVYGWSDSTIVLAWLSKHPSTWRTFIANRVETIQSLIPTASWKHVPTADNPADCATRGIYPLKLLNHELWWSGPKWLSDSPTTWPTLPDLNYNCDVKTTATKIHMATTDQSYDFVNKLSNRYSSWPKLLRITALVFKFINKCKTKLQSTNSEVNNKAEMHSAKLFLFKNLQSQFFASERRATLNKLNLKKSSPLKALNPFIDKDGLLRVSGRLSNAPIAWETKHPIILPNHRISLLIAQQTHLRSLHGGPQMTLFLLRQNFWIIKGRNLVRSIVHKCLTCARHQATLQSQLMANLPSCRVTPSNPFTHCGLDYAGPISVKLNKGRGYKSTKGYIVLFVCMVTRAIHLELVSDYSSSTFLSALKRFVSRRGIPSNLYSDNGRNFVGADKELRRIFKTLKCDPKVSKDMSAFNINWDFIPPYSPHFGESCLNSRPIAAFSNEVDDYSYLSPGHFLIGKPLLAMPEKSLPSSQHSLLTRWQLVQQKTEQFWKQWSLEYQQDLQKRYKWTKSNPNIKIGDLVLIRDINLPKSNWQMGRVLKIHPGKDGLVRVVTVKTKKGSPRNMMQQYQDSMAIVAGHGRPDLFIAMTFSSIKSVKYLYKYILNGHDDASIVITNANGEVTVNHNEIHHYEENRYVGPVEAVWRILSKPLEKKSHSVNRLPIHLPNEQNVIIREEKDLKGATFFESLRTVNGVVHESFTTACLAFGLVEDDSEWIRTIEEAALWMMLHSLRQLFTRILIQCHPVHPVKLYMGTI
ncbi:uncharacterized protein LOC122509074 [Leptopilina heterotoma]|uniref:uncharacterized protein LOC122509074 n=1 Tax=Leptopilina heterotoma TaxID=63436 RepID=UPI001CA92EF6|nr:uncharacterized protein LOC122509074 [Leptopilina heterotoma]